MPKAGEPTSPLEDAFNRQLYPVSCVVWGGGGGGGKDALKQILCADEGS